MVDYCCLNYQLSSYIINSDQGSQSTNKKYIDFLSTEKIRQSMDGKAHWVDNAIMECWFYSLKCEEMYINEGCVLN